MATRSNELPMETDGIWPDSRWEFIANVLTRVLRDKPHYFSVACHRPDDYHGVRSTPVSYCLLKVYMCDIEHGSPRLSECTGSVFNVPELSEYSDNDIADLAEHFYSNDVLPKLRHHEGMRTETRYSWFIPK